MTGLQPWPYSESPVPLVVYIAGPFRAETAEGRAANVAKAKEAAQQIMLAGHFHCCPHLTCELEWPLYQRGQLTLDWCINGHALTWLRRCDAILLLPGWEASEGAKIEEGEAARLGMFAFYHTSALPLIRSEHNAMLRQLLQARDEWSQVARRRIIMAHPKYGDEWATRDNWPEIRDEALDLDNYLLMALEQLRGICAAFTALRAERKEAK